MLQRNLSYTAITRGRKLVALVGSRKALWRTVTNFETKTRFSRLQERLRARNLHRKPRTTRGYSPTVE